MVTREEIDGGKGNGGREGGGRERERSVCPRGAMKMVCHGFRVKR